MIVIVNGKVRQGKGILISLFALALCEEGYEVLVNFPLNHPNARQITVFEFLQLIGKQLDMNKKALVIQEIWGWLNSHKSMSNVSELEDTFVFQSGKLGYDIYADTQVHMRTLGSLRDMCDLRFEATKIGDTKVDFENGYFEYFPLNVKNHDDNERIGEGFRIPFRLASVWWDQYDTFARTMPVGYANLVAACVKVEPLELIRFVGRQVGLLLEHRDLWLRPDRVSVQCALLELGESDVYASLVSNRLQLVLGRMRGLERKGQTPHIEGGIGLTTSRWRR